MLHHEAIVTCNFLQRDATAAHHCTLSLGSTAISQRDSMAASNTGVSGTQQLMGRAHNAIWLSAQQHNTVFGCLQTGLSRSLDGPVSSVVQKLILRMRVIFGDAAADVSPPWAWAWRVNSREECDWMSM